MAATLAKGRSVIQNAAREPEVVDQANCLIAMGANIQGAGTDTITVEGVERLCGATYSVLPDRIETGSTWSLPPPPAPRQAQGQPIRPFLEAVLAKLEEAGAHIATGSKLDRAGHEGNRPRAVTSATAPYPAFPTDMQAQFISMNAVAEGTGTVVETHLREPLHARSRDGAHGRQTSPSKAIAAFVTGVPSLKAAPVMRPTLRASA